MKSSIWILLLALLSIGCDKDNDAKVDTESPSISILQPDTISIYTSQANLPIVAEIIENDQLHDISVEVTNLNNQIVEFSTHTHQHDQSTIYETSMWVSALTEAVEYEVKITATDHIGNSSESAVTVVVQP